MTGSSATVTNLPPHTAQRNVYDLQLSGVKVRQTVVHCSKVCTEPQRVVISQWRATVDDIQLQVKVGAA